MTLLIPTSVPTATRRPHGETWPHVLPPSYWRKHSVSRPKPVKPTTTIERLILASVIVLLPLQDHLPTVGPVSIAWLLFGVLATFVAMFRGLLWPQVAVRGPFLALYLLILTGFVVELSHADSDLLDLWRIAEMVLGATFVATVCRDKAALRWASAAFLLAGLWMSVYLFFTIYGGLQSATATDFSEASMVRSEVLASSSLRANPNTMSFVAAQGVIVAVVYALVGRTTSRRITWLTIAIFCLIAAFLPMSRSGVAIAVLSSAVVASIYRPNRFKAIFLASLLGLGVANIVPSAAMSRMSVPTELPEGKMEARVRVLTATLGAIPEYALFGVGCGHFWSYWTWERDLHGSGAHNSFLQVTIYWGVLALAALLLAIVLTYRCLPRRPGSDFYVLALNGIAASLFLLLTVMHSLYTKEISLALGAIVGSHFWIWSRQNRVEQ
jgi:hypothetical protein